MSTCSALINFLMDKLQYRASRWARVHIQTGAAWWVLWWPLPLIMNFEVTLTTRSPRRSRDRWRRGWGAGSPSRCNTGSPTAAAGTASSSPTDTPVYWKKITSFIQGQLLHPQQIPLCIEKNHILHSYSKNSIKVNFYLPNRHPCVLKKITSFILTPKTVMVNKRSTQTPLCVEKNYILHSYEGCSLGEKTQPSFLL